MQTQRYLLKFEMVININRHYEINQPTYKEFIEKRLRILDSLNVRECHEIFYHFTSDDTHKFLPDQPHFLNAERLTKMIMFVEDKIRFYEESLTEEGLKTNRDPQWCQQRKGVLTTILFDLNRIMEHIELSSDYFQIFFTFIKEVKSYE